MSICQSVSAPISSPSLYLLSLFEGPRNGLANEDISETSEGEERMRSHPGDHGSCQAGLSTQPTLPLGPGDCSSPGPFRSRVWNGLAIVFLGPVESPHPADTFKRTLYYTLFKLPSLNVTSVSRQPLGSSLGIPGLGVLHGATLLPQLHS